MQDRELTAEQVALWAREAALEYQADLARLQYMADRINALRAGDLAMIESLSEKVATMSAHLGRLAEKQEARTPLPTVDDERCETCKFWFRKDSESGDCRRYPPTSHDAVPMDYEDWCGEWRACGPKGGAG